MKRVVAAAVVVVFAGVLGMARADDKAKPAGTWKWEVTGQNGNKIERTLKLKLDGDKLSGTMSGRQGRETKIEDASFKDGEVSFSVTRERNGQKTTTKYKGKLSGDKIEGKFEFERNGEAQ